MTYFLHPPAHSLHVGSVTMGIEHPVPIGGDFFQPFHHDHCIDCGRPGHLSCGINSYSRSGSIPQVDYNQYSPLNLINLNKSY
jgi:hypothetical protein